MVNVIRWSGHRDITLVDGGSRRDAHTLWSRYHDLPAAGAAKSPRLLRISLAKLETDSVPGSGTYWVVYLDRVWSLPLGGPGPGAFAREVTFVDPDTLQQVMSTTF